MIGAALESPLASQTAYCLCLLLTLLARRSIGDPQNSGLRYAFFLMLTTGEIM
jgi:hypothetical protein